MRERATFQKVVDDLHGRVGHREEWEEPRTRRQRMRAWWRAKLRQWGQAKDGLMDVWACDRHAIGDVKLTCALCLDEALEVQHLAKPGDEQTAERLRELEAACVTWKDRALAAEAKHRQRRRRT